MDACHRHCGCSTGITAPGDATGRPQNPKQAFASFYASLWSGDRGGSAVTGEAALKQQLWKQGGSYPCETCCPAGQAQPGVSFVNDSRAGCGGASDDSGCSYNGKAAAGGRCICDPQWAGPQCARLNLVPTSRDAGCQWPPARLSF